MGTYLGHESAILGLAPEGNLKSRITRLCYSSDSPSFLESGSENAIAMIPTPGTLVEPIRTASRELVRELGFMSGTLAGTSYSPSAVHALIEIGSARATTTAELCDILHLKVENTNIMLEYLAAAGEIKITGGSKEGEESLSLTLQGQQSLADINTFARDQVLQALDHVNGREAETVLLGLQTYVASLHAQRTGKRRSSFSQIEIVQGYTPGLIGRALEMHAAFYSRIAGFGAFFEIQLATGLADLVSRIEDDRNEVWTARLRGRIVGTIFIDGGDQVQNRAHLRAFILDDEVRGGGIGRRLLRAAIKFVDEKEFDETYLWTFQGLDAARYLYESFHFTMAEERRGTQWGREVTEQQFIRRLRAKE